MLRWDQPVYGTLLTVELNISNPWQIGLQRRLLSNKGGSSGSSHTSSSLFGQFQASIEQAFRTPGHPDKVLYLTLQKILVLLQTMNTQLSSARLTMAQERVYDFEHKLVGHIAQPHQTSG